MARDTALDEHLEQESKFSKRLRNEGESVFTFSPLLEESQYQSSDNELSNVGTSSMSINVASRPHKPLCRKDPQRFAAASYKRPNRQRKYSHSQPAVQLPSYLRSTPVLQSQLAATSVSLLGSKGMPASAFPLHYILWSLSSNNHSAAFINALNAFSLIQIGVTFQDENLKQHATTSYFAAVQKLRIMLLRASHANDSFSQDLLAIPYLLVLSARFAPIARAAGGSFGLGAHLEGLARLLAAQQRPKSNLQLLLEGEYHHYAWLWCIRTRRTMHYCMSDDDIVALEAFEGNTQQRCITKLVSNLPEILERHDCLKEFGGSEASLGEQILLEDVKQLQQNLQSWLRSWHRETKSRGSDPYVPVPAFGLPAFISELDELSTTVFKTGFNFPGFFAANSHVRIWHAMLVCSFVELEILENGTQAMLKEIAQCRKEILARADQICRALIYLYGPSEGTIHAYLVARRPLPDLLRSYRLNGESEKEAWCRALKETLDKKDILGKSDW